MPKEIKYHIFGGKRYKIEFVDGRKIPLADGDVDLPSEKNKTIRFWKKMDKKDKLRVWIHEACHIFLPNHEEIFIDKMSTDIARFLERLGYKLEK